MKTWRRGANSRFRVALQRVGYESVSAAAKACGLDRTTLQRLLRDGIKAKTLTGTVAALKTAGLYDLCARAHG